MSRLLRNLRVRVVPSQIRRAMPSVEPAATRSHRLWLWTSISAIAAAPPKLPSIWNGGWASNISGYVPLRTQQETENAERMVAIPKPRPEIDAPRRGPARRLIAADLERAFRSRRQFRRIPAIDLPAWIEAEQMGNVTVVGRRLPACPNLPAIPATAPRRRSDPGQGEHGRLPVHHESRSRARGSQRHECNRQTDPAGSAYSIVGPGATAAPMG